MLPLLIPMAVGAVGGALMNKKKPLNGALLGAGLGAGAGAAAPALGGLLGGSAAPAAAAAPWADGAGAVVAPAATPGTGLLASTNAAMSKYSPMINAASTGLQMSGALDPQQPGPQAPQPMQVQGGTETLASLANQGGAQQMQGDMQERMRRRQVLRGGV